MNYKCLILNKLLEKYEKSKSYSEECNRKIILNMSELREYDIENYEIKSLINSVIIELSEENLIDFAWQKYEKNNIIQKIWLNKDNILESYRLSGRKNIKLILNDLLNVLNNINFKEEWLNSFKQDMILFLNSSNKENSYLPSFLANDILTALKEIDNICCEENINYNTSLKRVFSIKCYKDSKYFENNIEKYIIKIIKKYLLPLRYKTDYFENMTDDEILLEVGISKAPEVIEFSGANVQVELNSDNKSILYSKNVIGNYINSITINSIKKLHIKDIKKVIFIENKTNYLDYILNKITLNELVIYHGGMYSPNKGKFFQKIYDVLKDSNCEFYHWSDIDLGGFNIFCRLKENIIPELKPYLMDKTALMEIKKYWKKIDEKYKEKLIQIHKNEQYNMFFEVLDFMIENGIKGEQEGFLIDSVKGVRPQ